MKKFIATTLLLSFLLTISLQPIPGFSWNSTGHRVIAAIAWENLTPTAKNRIIEILKQAPNDSDLTDLYDTSSEFAEKEFFMGAAYWPDIVRDRDEKVRYEKYHKGHWHYIGSYWKQTENGPVKADGPVEDENIVERITYFKKTLADPNVSDADKAVQIAWVLHLIGDIHMPLHNTSQINADSPEGDLGGNRFRLGDEWPWNLHAFWDGILDVANPKAEDVEDFDYYLSNAKQITEKHTKKSLSNSVELADATKWNEEGKQLTMNKVYPSYLKQNEQPPAAYKKEAYTIAQKQMALSGYRMAAYLNEIFGQ
jgi:hypothetical protein